MTLAATRSARLRGASVVLSGSLLAVACVPAGGVRPSPTVARTPAREIIVRSSFFSFHMGALVDTSWPAKADETRAALGQLLPVLLEEEDTVVPVLARQLGVAWPAEPVDVNVVFRGGAAPCEVEASRPVDVSEGRPRTFFACVLERALARSSPTSGVFRGIEAHHGSALDDARPRDRLYGCIVTFAVSAVLVVRAESRRDAQALEERLGTRCEPATLEWLAREWIKRVRDAETAEAFGARAMVELASR